MRAPQTATAKPSKLAIALIDHNPSFSTVIGRYIDGEGEELQKELGVSLEVKYFTFDNVIRENVNLNMLLGESDMLLVGVEPRVYNFLERFVSSCKALQWTGKLLAITENPDPRLSQLLSRVGLPPYVEKPSTNREFKALFERLYAMHLANTK